jgi:hypothetical protein
MKSVQLNRYREHLQKMAEAQSREEQIDAIRSQKFRASVVSDPLSPHDDIAGAIDILRTRK